MIIIKGLVQGSPEWLKHRAGHHNASEAAAIFNEHKFVTRNELLRMKKTGTDKEFSDYVQKMILDKGHESEKLARPIVERILDQELYPVSATDNDGWLAMSSDGLTIDDTINFEHKQRNASLVLQIESGELDPHYYWQLEQQLLISGAEKVFFACSNGTEESLVWCWYKAVPGRAEKLIAGWKQFEKDLADYVVEDIVVPVRGCAPDDLPALNISVSAVVSAPDLAAFKEQALEVFRGINRVMQTDEDFANAEKTVKWCKGIEDKLKATKENALSQTSDLDLVLRTIDSMAEEARSTRLELEKLVKARKDSVRNELLAAARSATQKHIDSLNASLGSFRINAPLPDFVGCIKGLKTFASTKNALDSAIAEMKIATNEIAMRLQENIKAIELHCAGYDFLFADRQSLAEKDTDSLIAIIKTRIADHEREEAARVEREVARRMEQERLRAEAVDREQRLQAEAAEREKEYKAQETVTAVAEQKKAESTRKKDPVLSMSEQILHLVATHFGVTTDVADKWLSEYEGANQTQLSLS